MLEGAPTGLFRSNAQWLPTPDNRQGWGWPNAQRQWLLDRAQWQVHGLKRLREMIALSAHRPTTVIDGNPAFVLDSSAIRPGWYLACPEVSNPSDTESRCPHAVSSGKRCFAVQHECLLIPAVGNIVSEPVVIPEAVLQRGAGPLMVPIHWLPLIGLRYPRALAIVLDHPFGRLQRQLGMAFSTAPHITRETVENLLIPELAEAQWQAWEEELCRAQHLFIEALTTVTQTIAIVEAWYA